MSARTRSWTTVLRRWASCPSSSTRQPTRDLLSSSVICSTSTSLTSSLAETSLMTRPKTLAMRPRSKTFPSSTTRLPLTVLSPMPSSYSVSPQLTSTTIPPGKTSWLEPHTVPPTSLARTAIRGPAWAPRIVKPDSKSEQPLRPHLDW